MNNIVRLNVPPVPNIADPHAQLNWIFFLAEARVNDKSAKYIKYVKNIYLRYLQETNAGYSDLAVNPRFYLSKHWEYDALIRFNAWLLKQDLASKTRYAIYKYLRKTMDLAYGLRVIDTIVYHAPMFKGVKETKERAAYSARELEVLNAAISKWISLGASVLSGYVPTGKGIPFRQMNTINSVTVDGKLITTVEASKIYGISRETIQQRLRLGWSDLEAIGIDKRKTPGAIPVIVNGIEYASIEIAANAFNFKVSTVRARMWSGQSPDEAFGFVTPTPKLKPHKTPITLEETTYPTISAASLAYGFNKDLINNRLRAGWSIEEAFELKNRVNNQGKSITIEGIEYSSMTQAAKAYGLNHKVITDKIRLGATPEQAAGLEAMVVNIKDERAHLWAFENIYKCDPLAMLNDLRDRNIINNYQLGAGRLEKLFIRWGVWPYVDARLIMPLAAQLAMLTGLNVEAIKNLTIDCYSNSHPLTGQPVLYYHKLRSGSSKRSDERELHVPFLELDQMMVDTSVAAKIQTLVEMVLELTKKIRTSAPEKISDLLFIFEHVERSKSENRTVIVPIEPGKKSQTWTNIFCKEENLFEILGENFLFNLSRCRPTLATNMILAGADLLQVQTALGHQNAQTTESYLDGLQLRPVFNKTISQALQNISQRSLEQKTIEDSSKQQHNSYTNQDDKFAFNETLSGCGCKNAFNPSENVKKATNFKEGSICKYWNMCLLCDNSVITQNSLPKLMVYRERVSKALISGSPAITARTKLYGDTVALIDGILEPDHIFPGEVIEKARILAASENSLFIDQLVYQGL